MTFCFFLRQGLGIQPRLHTLNLSECWDYKCAPSHLALTLHFGHYSVLHMKSHGTRNLNSLAQQLFNGGAVKERVSTGRIMKFGIIGKPLRTGRLVCVSIHGHVCSYVYQCMNVCREPEGSLNVIPKVLSTMLF